MSIPNLTYFKKIDDLSETVQKFWVEKYQVSELISKEVFERYLSPYLLEMKDDLHVVIEFPYVDKMYRDSYYHYYSSKLQEHHRNCIRLSFFNREITQFDFRNQAKVTVLQQEKAYLGFIVLRPTFPKIIGRTALAPQAMKHTNFACCLANIQATVDSVKFSVDCFPHSSQDSQTIKCAETTIWSLMEYFGNKYADYKPVLASRIHQILYRYSYKRQMPSEGLTAEQVTYAIRELDFGAMIYSRKKTPNFDTIVSIYIESGIPIVGVIKNEFIGHAVNIVGREKLDADFDVMDGDLISEDGRQFTIIDFNKLQRKFVLVDDNYPPYQLGDIDTPCKNYCKDEKWHDCELTNIIVPLYPKIYLEAVQARHNFYQYLKNKKFGIIDGEKKIVRIFLASSRTYKHYLALESNLDERLKTLCLGIAMPKFVWIAEISKPGDFERGICEGFILQDATEAVKHTSDEIFGNLTLILGYLNGKYFTQSYGRFTDVNIFAPPFNIFRGNLY